MILSTKANDDSSLNETKEIEQGIARISVQGYKSLYDESSIEIRPLTILAGANSSGKSSIMQPLLLMKQTLESPYDPGALLINGANVKFTSLEQLLSYISDKKHAEGIKIKIEDSQRSLTNFYIKNNRRRFDINQVNLIDNGREIIYFSQMSKQDLIEVLENSIQRSPKAEHKVVFDTLSGLLKREKCFLNITIKSQYPSRPTIGNLTKKQLEVYLSNYEQDLGDLVWYDSTEKTLLFVRYLFQLIHIPGLRGNPERTYVTTAIGKEFQGTFEQYTASIISDWQDSDDERLKKLAEYLEHLGLTSKIQATQINDVQIELQVGQLPKASVDNMVNIADVGLGVSQVLPIIVALLVAEPGQLVYIEQPELHLHPRAQVALSNILADAARRGVKTVIETHSELLLLGVQSLVAEGKLDPKLIKLHWFTKREDGITKINSADLDEIGAFGDWPEDFGDVSLNIQNRYLSAAEAKLWKQSHG